MKKFKHKIFNLSIDKIYFKTYMLKFLFSLLLIFFCVSIYFPSNQDSLLEKFNNIKLSDSVRFEALYKHTFQIGKSNKDDALKLGYKALDFAKKSGSKFLEAKSYRLIGKFNGDSALIYNIKSLKLIEGTNDFLGLASTYNNIAGVYSSINEYKKALNFRYKSIDFAEKSGDKNMLAICYMNIGGLLMTEDDEKSFYYKFKAIKLYEELKDTNSLIVSYSMLGNTYFNIPDSIEKAGYYYKKALQIAKKRKQYKEIAGNYCMVGGYYLNKGDFKTALLYLDTSDQINKSKNNNDHWVKLTILKDQESAFFNLKQYNLAYLARLEADSIEDKYFNENKKKNTQELIGKFENEKKLLEEEKNKIKQIEEKKRQKLIIVSTLLLLFALIIFTIIVFRRYTITKNQKIIIENKEKETQNQKHLIEEKQKEILDSINYAKRIQYTLLAHEEFLKQNLNDHFTFFNPKDVVSGDFYWATTVGSGEHKKFYLAVCDSTGHGVPGAFMSLLNIGFLGEAINEKGIEKPNEVFEFVRKKLTETISKEGQKDGFDGILLCVDKSSGMITYAAANNAPVLVRKHELIELSNDRMPVGVGERKQTFELFTIEHQKGDIIYLYTDGYPDQFGGPKGKKFKYKQLNELLLANANLPLAEQRSKLKSEFENWKGDLEQVDDVCVIGIRI
jgi:serine phosphatase RsbU (regulator of sigma subunit)